MNPERKDFLSLKTPPARVNVQEAAWYLGFAPHDVPILVAVGLLKPLGHPPHTGTKYFAIATLEQLRVDLKWLARASDAIVNYWQNKNGRKTAAQSAKLPNSRRFKRGLPTRTDDTSETASLESECHLNADNV